MITKFKNLENKINILLVEFELLQKIQIELELYILNLNQWISNWKEISAIIKKKTYTLNETILLAGIFGCTVKRIGTSSRYNLLIEEKILFSGKLTEIVDYCFSKLIG